MTSPNLNFPSLKTLLLVLLEGDVLREKHAFWYELVHADYCDKEDQKNDQDAKMYT